MFLDLNNFHPKMHGFLEWKSYLLNEHTFKSKLIFTIFFQDLWSKLLQKYEFPLKTEQKWFFLCRERVSSNCLDDSVNDQLAKI